MILGNNIKHNIEISHVNVFHRELTKTYHLIKYPIYLKLLKSILNQTKITIDTINMKPLTYTLD